MNRLEREKKRQELHVFQALAPLAGLTVVPESISQPEPPAPDIACEVARYGKMTFELTALDASSTRQRLAHMQATPKAWIRALGYETKTRRKQIQDSRWEL
jgi:hypothetical protein